MTNVAKIRDLVDKHPDDDKVVLNDLINNLVNLQTPLGKLEIHNYKESINDALKLIYSHEKLLNELKYRIKNEVRPEVLKFHNNKPKKKKKQHPNSLKNLKGVQYKEQKNKN